MKQSFDPSTTKVYFFHLTAQWWQQPGRPKGWNSASTLWSLQPLRCLPWSLKNLLRVSERCRPPLLILRVENAFVAVVCVVDPSVKSGSVTHEVTVQLSGQWGLAVVSQMGIKSSSPKFRLAVFFGFIFQSQLKTILKVNLYLYKSTKVEIKKTSNILSWPYTKPETGDADKGVLPKCPPPAPQVRIVAFPIWELFWGSGGQVPSASCQLCCIQIY